MNQFYYVLNDVSPVGRFGTEEEAKAAQAAVGESAYILQKPEDVLAVGLQEPSMRIIRAALKLIEKKAKVDDMREAATAARDADAELSKREKNKVKAAEALMSALSAHDWSVVPGDPDAAKRTRPSAKSFIRELFPEVGDKLVPLEGLSHGGQFTPSAVNTAICDLKNPKYAGADGVMTLERVKAEDGSISYKRTA